MNYIVFDLEWNQCPYGKEKEIPEMPFEIIDVGAVKLDGEKRTVSKFHEFIKPVVYKKLHFRTREKINISADDISRGRPFGEVIKEFFEWCGQDYMFCTWGSQDTIELQKNLDYFGLGELLPKPFRFLNIQKLYAVQYNGNRRCSLSAAVSDLGIPLKKDFHEAYDDAAYTAEVFRHISDDVKDDYFSIDYYRNPKTPEEEIFVRYKKRTKFISREYRSREQAMTDKKLRHTECPLCGTEPETLIEWSVKGTGKYLKLANCHEHGYIRGKIRLKAVPANKNKKKYFAVKMTQIISSEKAAELIKELRAR